MRIDHRLRINATWTFEEGVEVHPLSGFEQIIKELVDHLNRTDPDIVCFQEFPVLVNGERILIDAIANQTNLKHHVEIDTSPSFLFEGGRIGIAVFSKTPFVRENVTMFVNPNISMVSKSGKTYYSFDKGIVEVELENGFVIVSFHGIPFYRFSENPLDYPETFEPLRKVIDEALSLGKKVVMAGDLNVNSIFEVLPQYVEQLTDVIVGTTTLPGKWGHVYYPDGRKLDCILISNNLKSSTVTKERSFSDHYICSCEILEK